MVSAVPSRRADKQLESGEVEKCWTFCCVTSDKIHCCVVVDTFQRLCLFRIFCMCLCGSTNISQVFTSRFCKPQSSNNVQVFSIEEKYEATPAKQLQSSISSSTYLTLLPSTTKCLSMKFITVVHLTPNNNRPSPLRSPNFTATLSPRPQSL